MNRITEIYLNTSSSSQPHVSTSRKLWEVEHEILGQCRLALPFWKDQEGREPKCSEAI